MGQRDASIDDLIGFNRLTQARGALGEVAKVDDSATAATCAVSGERCGRAICPRTGSASGGGCCYHVVTLEDPLLLNPSVAIIW